MRARHKGLLTLLLALVVQFSFAQEKTVTGTVTDQSDLPLPGVNILVEGTTNGTQTDFDGNYSISANEGDVLLFTYIGQADKAETVGASDTINVQMTEDAQALDEVVVTALGISKEKQALGYATTQVSGDEVNTAKETNFMNSLSGKVAGLDIKKSSSLGGSSNIILRGYTSLTGNNQPLFVVDGTPIGNDNNSTTSDDDIQTDGQTQGQGGYDYGNAAMDINPEDIESVNVLKGAAASNLYGSRAANGVIIITTKKGSKGKGLGITINSGVTMAKYDPDTFPKYQNQYGAGYGPFYENGPGGYFSGLDVDGDGVDDLTTPFTEDASQGGAFNPNLLVYQWDAFYPESPTYLQATPWVARKHGPEYIFNTGVTLNNSVSVSAGSETGSFRLGFTSLDQSGIVPNSKIKRNSVDFNGSQQLSEKLTAGVKATFTKTDGKGRYGTGYDGRNIMQQFRQWNQINVDYKQQEEAYFATGRNVSWNYGGNPLTPDGQTAIFFDNPYFTQYENFETDTRNRLFGNFNLNYDAADWLSITARTSLDTFSELQEERLAITSVGVPEYSRFNRTSTELNYDLLFNYDFDLTGKLTLDGVVGATARQNRVEWIRAKTSGGLVVPKLYSLSNSINLLEPPVEYMGKLKQYGFFANASFAYDGFLYLDLSGRYDISSTLPTESNGFFYPAVSTSLVFSKLLDLDWMSLGKFRANYAQVGNSTSPYRVFDTYFSPTNFSVPLFSTSSQKSNENLVNELSDSFELGLEMSFANKRAGFDVSYYKTNTIDQIFPVTVTRATGYSSRVINSGEVQNDGIEAAVFLSPVRTEDFEWRINATWAKNNSEVISLFTNETTGEAVENVELGSFQGGITVNATVGEPYGSIWGSNYTYLRDAEGNITNSSPIINAETGKYVRDATPQPIGDINPEWKGGVSNTLTYKNLSFSFLIDIQKGGDVFSLDTWYGYATGVYDVTAGFNELGNLARDPVAEGGGILLEGINPDGSPNTTRSEMDFENALGYRSAPNALHLYDASYVKLREMTFSYKLPSKLLKNSAINNMTFSLTGRNLWIIDKNMPYSDPEAGLSAGNLQGYQSSPYPTSKEYGFNVRFDF